jgi:hypothetical protein
MAHPISLTLTMHGPLAPLLYALTSRLSRRYLAMEVEGFRRAGGTGSRPDAPAHQQSRQRLGAGRRQITPWAYSHLRGLALVRFTIGIFLAGLAAVMLSLGHSGLAALPLVGAALDFSIGYLDITVAPSAPYRT